jgi:ABC-type antimicrobial peptide transport system permease subunit
MVWRNLLRRKGRTVLTVLGVSIGVAVIIGLGSLGSGLQVGYSSMLAGSNADLILSEPDAYDLSMSSIDETVGPDLLAMPEVSAVSGMLQGLVQAENNPYFFVFGYPEGSFTLDRYHIIQGVDLYSLEATRERGRPMILGSAAAEAMHKTIGDTLRLGDSAYRVVGIYESGQAFEDGGAVIRLADAQELLGMQRQVSAFYLQLDQRGADVQRLRDRLQRLYPDLSLSTAEDLGQRNQLADSVNGMVWGVAALAILIGGVSTMNSQLMSVMERTREIGVLRAVGWRRWRVMVMILGESLAVSLVGGIVGVGLAQLMLRGASGAIASFGATPDLKADLLIQAFVIVFLLGLVGGLYPAYRASQLQPIEALRYEGGSGGADTGRLPVGGMALRNLWRRKARTFLTLGVIGLTVGAIMALNAILVGTVGMMTDFFGGSEIVVRKADTADMAYSFVDERTGDRIRAMPDVRSIDGVLFSAIISPDMGMFIILGYNPRGGAIQQFQVVDGERLVSNRQIMLGKTVAEAQNLGVGDTITVSGQRFQIKGIYEHSIAMFEMGGVITLRDAQTMMGRQRKVTFFSVDVNDPSQASQVVDEINQRFPEVHASLSGEFANQLPDLQNTNAMADGIAFIAILVGGFGMMNTMLMAVLERTREIGVLRALGWRRRQILSLILRESLALSIFGALVGVAIAFGLASLLAAIPGYGSAIRSAWTADVFIRSMAIALGLGLVGGIFPAIRATRLQPVEALRYE